MLDGVKEFDPSKNIEQYRKIQIFELELIQIREQQEE